MIYDPHIRTLHVELSNRCNARCPMCSRTNNKRIEDDPDEITLERFQKYFSVEFLQQLDNIKFCGNFGDPAIAKDCIEIHQYIDSVNPTINMVFHTNGGLRTKKFWKQLGEVYVKQPNRMIVFHIDGLKDTNHIYRVDVDYDKVIENASAAIKTKANCIWAFIPFMHNEHQVEEAESEANRLGFTKFAIKVSARFQHKLQPFKYVDGRTGIQKMIFPTTSSEFNVKKLLENLDTPICAAEKRRELYVSARGEAIPCCWYASGYQNNDAFREQIDTLCNPNLNERPLEEILMDPLYNGAIKQSWKDQSVISTPCYKKCTGKEMHFWSVDGEMIPQKQIKEWMDD